MNRLKWTYSLLIVFFLASCGKTDELHDPTEGMGAPPDEFKEAFHAAMSAKMIGQYDRAIPLFEECLELKPKSGAVHFALSDLYEKTKQTSKAIEYAERAHQLDESNKWYKLRLANLYFDQQNFQKSADYFKMVMADEKNLELKYKYTEALMNSRQFHEAIDMLDEIEVETGKTPEISITKHELYMQMGDMEGAINELEALLQYDPSNIENRMVVADYLMRSSQLVRAQEIVYETIEKYPESGNARVMLADMYLRSNKVDEAFKELRVAFEKEDLDLNRKLELIYGLMPFAFNPQNPDGPKTKDELAYFFSQLKEEGEGNETYHQYNAMFLQRSGDYTGARGQFRALCELNPGSYDTWKQLLTIDYELDMYKELFEDGKEAIELFPSQPLLYLLTGIGAYESEKYEEAEEWLFLGKDLVVNDNMLLSDFLYHLGTNSSLNGDSDGASAYFKQALVADPTNGKVYYYNVLKLLDQEKVSEAEEVIKDAMSKNPEDMMLKDAYGLVLLKKKNYAEAVSAFEQALMPDVFNPLILEHYGDALFLLGDTEKAVEIWENAKKYGGESELLNRKIADKKYYED